MSEILPLLTCLTFEINNTSLKHLGRIIQAMLARKRNYMTAIQDWALAGGLRMTSNCWESICQFTRICPTRYTQNLWYWSTDLNLRARSPPWKTGFSVRKVAKLSTCCTIKTDRYWL